MDIKSRNTLWKLEFVRHELQNINELNGSYQYKQLEPMILMIIVIDVRCLKSHIQKCYSKLKIKYKYIAQRESLNIVQQFNAY